MGDTSIVQICSTRYEEYVQNCQKRGKTPMSMEEWTKRYGTITKKDEVVVPLCIDERIYREFLTIIGEIYKRKKYATTVIEYLMQKELEHIAITGIRSEITTRRCLEIIGENINEKGKMFKTSFKVNRILAEKAVELLGNKEISSFIRGLIISYICDKELREEVLKATTLNAECPSIQIP